MTPRATAAKILDVEEGAPQEEVLRAYRTKDSGIADAQEEKRTEEQRALEAAVTTLTGLKPPFSVELEESLEATLVEKSLPDIEQPFELVDDEIQEPKQVSTDEVAPTLSTPPADKESKIESPVGTLVAKGGPLVYTGPLPDDIDELTELALDLQKLYDHYKDWSWLAEGSWGELEKVQQIKQNCRSAEQLLRGRHEFKAVPGYLTLASQFRDLASTTLAPLQTSGLQKTYLFCNEHFKGANALPNLNARIYPDSSTTLGVSDADAVVCFVGSGEHQAAFVQGTRHIGSDPNTFVSDAHYPPKLNKDVDKMREFVFSQVESFHADPRNVGKTISFEGNYSQEFLKLAIHYCDLRGYAWQVEPALKAGIINKNYTTERPALEKLLNPTRLDGRDPSEEKKWQTWFIDQSKAPFSTMLDKATVASYENSAKLKPLSKEDAESARMEAIEMANKKVDVALRQHEIAKSPPVTAATRSNVIHKPKLSVPSVIIRAAEPVSVSPTPVKVEEQEKKAEKPGLHPIKEEEEEEEKEKKEEKAKESVSENDFASITVRRSFG